MIYLLGNIYTKFVTETCNILCVCVANTFHISLSARSEIMMRDVLKHSQRRISDVEKSCKIIAQRDRCASVGKRTRVDHISSARNERI